MTLLIGSTLQCLALVFYLVDNSLTSLYLTSALFGLFQGGIVPSYAIIVREYFPPREAATRVGLAVSTTVLGMALGGWMGGLLNERFINRLSGAKADSLLDAEGLIDPAKCWKAMMANEKPGGHGERSVAVGVLDMALWDAVAKAKRVPLWKLLADRYNGGKYDDKAWVYAAGGYYYPGKDLEGLQDEMKHYLELGYSCVKMKV